ncbi:GAF domain-containing protein [Candidatus Gracilibacteria bacterium]|nr:GAF domain-containing protein [Candidatus Gracilibacteria bacterium]
MMREGLGRWVIEQREMALLSDARNDPRWLDLTALTPDNAGSALAVPIIDHERVVGVLTLSHHEPHHFHHSTLSLSALPPIR